MKTDPDFAQELLDSLENLIIDNNDLVLSTSLWRDFMPITEENGSKMICINKLTITDSLPILNTIELKKQYVIKGEEIWTADYGEINNDESFIL